jgi:hypothetical protein
MDFFLFGACNRSAHKATLFRRANAQSLKSPEAQRSRLLQQLQTLGDLHLGNISVSHRKCGRKGYARPEHPGHVPQLLWNTAQGARSRAQNLRPGPKLEKSHRERKNYDRFLRLCKRLVKVNEQICRSRPADPVRDEAEMQELKNLGSGSCRNGAGSRCDPGARLRRFVDMGRSL